MGKYTTIRVSEQTLARLNKLQKKLMVKDPELKYKDELVLELVSAYEEDDDDPY